MTFQAKKIISYFYTYNICMEYARFFMVISQKLNSYKRNIYHTVCLTNAIEYPKTLNISSIYSDCWNSELEEIFCFTIVFNFFFFFYFLIISIAVMFFFSFFFEKERRKFLKWYQVSECCLGCTICVWWWWKIKRNMWNDK